MGFHCSVIWIVYHTRHSTLTDECLQFGLDSTRILTAPRPGISEEVPDDRLTGVIPIIVGDIGQGAHCLNVGHCAEVGLRPRHVNVAGDGVEGSVSVAHGYESSGSPPDRQVRKPLPTPKLRVSNLEGCQVENPRLAIYPTRQR